MTTKKPTGWFTMNGKHVPIYEGESKVDAVKRAMSQTKKTVNDNEDAKEKQISDSKKAVTDKQRKAAEQYLKNVIWKKAIDGEQSAEISADQWKHAGISNDKMVSILNKHDQKHEYRIETTSEKKKMMGMNMTINHYYLCRDEV